MLKPKQAGPVVDYGLARPSPTGLSGVPGLIDRIVKVGIWCGTLTAVGLSVVNAARALGVLNDPASTVEQMTLATDQVAAAANFGLWAGGGLLLGLVYWKWGQVLVERIWDWLWVAKPARSCECSEMDLFDALIDRLRGDSGRQEQLRGIARERAESRYAAGGDAEFRAVGISMSKSGPGSSPPPAGSSR